MDNMTPQQKAAVTRQEHAEARAEKAKMKMEIRDIMTRELLTVIQNVSASPATKVKAAQLLMEIERGNL